MYTMITAKRLAALVILASVWTIAMSSINTAWPQGSKPAATTAVTNEKIDGNILQDAQEFANQSAEKPQNLVPTELRLRQLESRDQLSWWGMIFVSVTAAMAIILIVVFSMRNHIRDRSFVQASSLVFLVYGTIMIAIIVDTDQQLTAAAGILGAIAGYIFGTHASGSTQEREQG